MAVEVTCPIKVLKAKETMTERLTPLEHMCVSKISAGIIQKRGPQVAEKEEL